MPGRLAGRVALVTGGGGGIGEATGRVFAEEAAAVALLDSDAAAVEAAAAGIRAAVPGAQVLALAGDVTREADARRIVEEVAARLGGLHTLVNVAGVRVYAPLAEADAADWERIIGVNVLGTAHCCKAALPRLRASGRGTIVNVSSVYGLMGRTGMGQYDTTKAAVLGLTRALAVEEAPHRVRVNAVCPGGTITPYHIRRAAARGVSEAEMRTQRAGDNLLGRWAEPREVAYPILRKLGIPATFFVCPALVDEGRWLWTHEARARLRALGNDAATIESLVQQMKRMDLQTRGAVEQRLRDETAQYRPSAAEREAFDVASWAELCGLDPALVTIGSHTLTHPILTTLTEAEAEREICESRARLEARLGRPAETFCYPNGDVSAAVLALVRRTYRLAVTAGPGVVPPGCDPLLLPRLAAPRGLLRLAWQLSP